MNERIRAAAVILDSSHRLLLVHETETALGEPIWIPPGGGLEPYDDSVMECARREVLEEIGLSVKIGSLLFVREFIGSDEQVRHLELFFRATIEADAKPDRVSRWDYSGPPVDVVHARCVARAHRDAV